MAQSPIKLPSGAELKITLSPFAVSKDLYQAFLVEMKNLKMDPKQEIDANFFKDIFCVAFSSKEIEEKLFKCMEKTMYDTTQLKSKAEIESAFEPESARDDYFQVCFEVAKANIMPFTKSLYAQYSHIWELLKQKDPA
jgi:hypothetical protein